MTLFHITLGFVFSDFSAVGRVFFYNQRREMFSIMKEEKPGRKYRIMLLALSSETGKCYRAWLDLLLSGLSRFKVVMEKNVHKAG